MTTLPSLLTRRQTLRIIGGAALAVPLGLQVRDAGAARSWCRTDPTLSIGGLLANIYVSGEVDKRYDTSGPIKLVVLVPPGTATQVIAADNGFGYGYDIRFEPTKTLKNNRQRIELGVAVYVPGTAKGKNQAILVEFVPDGTVEVAARDVKPMNQWITLKTKLHKPTDGGG